MDSCVYAAPPSKSRRHLSGGEKTTDDMQSRIDRLEGLVLSLMGAGVAPPKDGKGEEASMEEDDESDGENQGDKSSGDEENQHEGGNQSDKNREIQKITFHLKTEEESDDEESQSGDCQSVASDGDVEIIASSSSNNEVEITEHNRYEVNVDYKGESSNNKPFDLRKSSMYAPTFGKRM